MIIMLYLLLLMPAFEHAVSTILLMSIDYTKSTLSLDQKFELLCVLVLFLQKMKLAIVFLAFISQGACAPVNKTEQIRQAIDSVADKLYNGVVAASTFLQSQNITNRTAQADYRQAIDKMADNVFNVVISASSFLESKNVTNSTTQAFDTIASRVYKPLSRDELAATTAAAIASRNRYTIDYVVDSVYNGVVAAARQGKASYEWFNTGAPFSTDLGYTIRNKLQLLFPDSEVRFVHNTFSVNWLTPVASHWVHSSYTTPSAIPTPTRVYSPTRAFI